MVSHLVSHLMYSISRYLNICNTATVSVGQVVIIVLSAADYHVHTTNPGRDTIPHGKTQKPQSQGFCRGALC